MKEIRRKTLSELLGNEYDGILAMIDGKCKVIRKNKRGNFYEVCSKPAEDESKVKVKDLPVETTLVSVNNIGKYKPCYSYGKGKEVFVDYCEYYRDVTTGERVHFAKE